MKAPSCQMERRDRQDRAQPCSLLTTVAKIHRGDGGRGCPRHRCFPERAQRAARSRSCSLTEGLPSAGSQDETTDCRAWL